MALIFEPDFTDAAHIADTNGDGSVIGASANVTPGAATGYGSTPGVAIAASGGIVYTALDPANFATSIFNPEKGTIEFWIKPAWNGWQYFDTGTQYLHLIDIYWSATKRFYCFLESDYTTSPLLLSNYIRTLGYGVERNSSELDTMGIGPRQWKTGTWHKVTIYWDFSLVSSYIIVKFDDKFTAIATSAASAPGDPASPALRLGCSSAAYANSIRATISGLKIHNTSLLPDGVGGFCVDGSTFPQAWYNPEDAAAGLTKYKHLNKTYDTVLASWVGDGFCTGPDNSTTEVVDCATYAGAEDTLFFRTNPTQGSPDFEWVLPGYVPVADQVGSNFSYKGTPGERESLFFNVYSRIDLSTITLTQAANFTGPGTILKTACDLRIVKNWFQAGMGSETSPYDAGGAYLGDRMPHYVPELLLHDDALNLDNTTGDGDAYVLPDTPVKDPIEITAIGAYTARQFVLIVDIPAGTPAGVYTTTITFDAAEIAAQTLTLTLTVLPFTLKDTGKVYSALVSASSPISRAAYDHSINWESMLTAVLQSMRDLGFNGIIWSSLGDLKSYYKTGSSAANYYTGDFGGTEFSALTDVGNAFFLAAQDIKLAACQSLGFRKVVIYDGNVLTNLTYTAALVALIESYDFEPWLYCVDEIQGGGDMTNQNATAALVEAAGGLKINTTIGNGATGARQAVLDVAADGHPLNGVYYCDWDYTYQCPIQAETAERDRTIVEGVYWQLRDETGRGDRYHLGYFLHVTGFDEAGGWSYFHSYNRNEFPGNPGSLATREYGSVFLAQDALTHTPVIIPTFQGLSAAEGIKDGKYLATWQDFHDRVKGSHPDVAANSKVTIDALLAKYKNTTGTNCSPAYQFDKGTFAADRETVITEILKLQALTGRRVGGVIPAKVGGVRPAKGWQG